MPFLRRLWASFRQQFASEQFARTQSLFLRCLGAIYAIAFASLAVQITGLIGERGILPAGRFFANLLDAYGNRAYVLIPSLFWLSQSNFALQAACWIGVIAGLAVAVRGPQRALLAVMYALYLSLSLAGQAFLGFQWDALLLEAGFLAIFFGRSERQQKIVAWLNRLLVLKLYFLSGWVKLASGDRTWADRSALSYHFHTQPLPTALAWYVDAWPADTLRYLTSVTLGTELFVPFLMFGPRPVRMAAAFVMIGLQLVIAATGNYTFFNLLTIALCVYLFEDRVWRWPLAAPLIPLTKRAAMAGTWLVVFLGFLNFARVWETTRGDPPPVVRVISDGLWPFQISNSYGLFAVMTKTRPEIVVEGSLDGEHWQPYEFRYKPGRVDRAPRWVAPHQPRLDWQMWFAALDDYRASPWFSAFAEKLLQGSPDVTALLATNPFAGSKPRYVRARLYDYRFTRSGPNWWMGEPVGEFFPAVSLKSGGN